MIRPAHLEPSALGTQQHWEELYNHELQNHAEDPSDQGTIWFEENNVEGVILEHLEGLTWRQHGVEDVSGSQIRSRARVTDIGTGNGHFLFALRDAGWTGEMVGLDYSAASVELARKIDKERQSEVQSAADGEEESSLNVMRSVDDEAHSRHQLVQFEVFDVLRDCPEGWLGEGFDLALDKGTFDAISLSPDSVRGTGSRGYEVYGARLAALVKGGGWLVVTSCNWTVEELRAWIEIPGLLEYGENIDFPVFEFGGVKGQTVSSVCFRRIADSPRLG